MRRSRFSLLLIPALLLSLSGAAATLAADDPDEEAKELAEKIAKAIKKSQEAQRKAAERTAKRERDEREDRTEAQQEAREKGAKEHREASRREAEAGKDVPKLEEQALDELEDAVETYVKNVHHKAAKSVPALPQQATPAEMTAHQRALADAIRALRPQARQGDLFVPESQPIVKRIIAAELAGRAGAPARKEILNGNPPIDPDRDDRMQVKVAVNAPYPAAAALSSVPPTVLLTLPILRKEVEYRFVNRDLVLMDVDANLILDFIPQAAPPLTGTTTTRR